MIIKSNTKILLLCALAVTMNVVLSEIVVLLNIPFLFLDAIGTIFIATNFKMRYGILTGFCTNFLTGLLTSPLAFPYAIVNILIAILVNLLARKSFAYFKAVTIGIIVALVTSLVSTPITIILFGGVTNSIFDALIFSLRSNGQSLFTSAYWGTASKNIIDKVISSILVTYLNNLSQIKMYLTSVKSSE